MHTQSLDNALHVRLSSLARHKWLPPALLHIINGTVYAQAAIASSLTPPVLPASAIASPEAHCQGRPLLTPALFPFDVDGAKQLWRTLLILLREVDGPTANASEYIAGDAALSPEAGFAALMQDTPESFASWEQATPQAPSVGRFLAQASLSPWLTATAIALAPHSISGIWTFGHCPCCGRLPYIGQLRGKEGQRWHVCSFCQHTYRVGRLQCPVCLEADTDKLRSFTADTVPGYSTAACDTCKHYIKLRDMDSYTLPSLSILDDVESLPLDVSAQEIGYIRATPSAWGC